MRRVLFYGLVGLSFVLSGRAQAQVTIDGTLKTNVSHVGNDFTIINGTARGSNLFHSFGQFSIPTGGSATFDLTNTAAISTIFSRVTGGIPSNIDGTIRTINSTNPVSLFLINPSGILFGANASLNIGGSFVGTTANSVKFADGTELSATSAIEPPLLTISAPIGLQMGQNPGAITLNGREHTLISPSPFAPILSASQPASGLQVKPNQTLALVGGDVTLNGGVVSAPQGRLEIVSGANGNVSLMPLSQGWHFNADSLQAYRDIVLTNRSALEASGVGNTAIALVGKTISLNNGSIALITTQGFQPPGTLQIKASESLQLLGMDQSGTFGSALISDVVAGTGADITIVAPQITLSNTVAIQSRAFGKSQAGNIRINATDIQADGQADPSTNLRTRIESVAQGQSNSGMLTISTDQLRILNGAIVSISNLGSGHGGDLTVTANTVKIDGIGAFTDQPGLLTTAILGKGDAGNLSLHTQELSVTRGGAISTATLASGNAGSLEITATRSIEVSGSLPTYFGSIAVSKIESGGTVLPREIQQALGLPPIPSGDAGNLTINTPSLKVMDGARIRVDNEGSGNAGTLRVNADSIYLKGGTIAAATAMGDGGNVSLQAQTLLLRDRASITATAGGIGNGGNITIVSPIVLGLANSDIVANAIRGQGGNIQITTQGLFGLQYRNALTLESDITASSQFGINGSVQINHIGADPNSGLVQLPINIIDPNQKIAQGCKADQGDSFVVTGRGGIPTNPMQQVNGDRTWADLRDLSRRATVVAQLIVAPLVEATTWQRNPTTGKVELIAAKPVQPNEIATCAPTP